MLSEFRKSINSILYERITSPLYGAFFFSWIVCNWRIFYLTFFVSESRLGANKVDYIISNYLDVWNLLWFPLISTALIITFVAWLNNQVFKLSLYFEEVRREWKENKQKTHRLTIEQSMEIRNEIADQNLRFDRQIQDKNKEKKQLSDQVERLTNDLTQYEKEKNSLKVLVAYFGVTSGQIEVTDEVNSLIAPESTLYFHVDVQTLLPGGDLIQENKRDFIMCFQFLGKYRILMAKEGEIVDFKNGDLAIIRNGKRHEIQAYGLAHSHNRMKGGAEKPN